MKTPIIAVAAYHFGKAKPELKQRVFVISSIFEMFKKVGGLYYIIFNVAWDECIDLWWRQAGRGIPSEWWTHLFQQVKARHAETGIECINDFRLKLLTVISQVL